MGLTPQGSLSQGPLSSRILIHLLDSAEKLTDDIDSSYSLILQSKRLLKDQFISRKSGFDIEWLKGLSFSQISTNQKESLIEANGL